ncbi:MAG: twin-arginine translocase TatA/TatE family subunit [Flavobacteriales bacterium]|nr:twin-arginine translocase TatA/TatE family subunit [Flavobacteriales bacterium]|tara:strand:- start:500 stop:679 length:180 start_codon:yes stop_codon:yes gene_type:complete
MISSKLLFALPGGTEWVLILVVVLLLFGGKKIPELMRGLGKGISEFKKGKKEIDKELKD